MESKPEKKNGGSIALWLFLGLMVLAGILIALKIIAG
jgi:hypothetical protein